MNPAFEYVPELIALGGAPTAQTALCPDCLQDMAQWRATPAAGNLRFKGPFLVRRELGYSVMTLPNTVHLHLGSAESVPVGQMRKAVQVAAAGPLRTKEGFIMSVSAEGTPESVKSALQQAGRDPAGPVRQAAELFAAKLADLPKS